MRISSSDWIRSSGRRSHGPREFRDREFREVCMLVGGPRASEVDHRPPMGRPRAIWLFVGKIGGVDVTLTRQKWRAPARAE
jgi:hypothetical protein